MQKQRYWMLDSLRGLAIINMIAFHLMWDLVYIYGVNASWYLGHGAYIWQQAICWTFIILSGFCFALGKKPLKRGLTVFVGGFIVSAVTLIFMPESAIRFGILTLLGSCMLIMVPIRKLLEKVPPVLGALLSFGLFFITRNVNTGYLGFGSINLIKLPRFLYANYFTAFWGFPHPLFSSSDYFSLFPWFFLFVFGYFLYRIFSKDESFKKFLKKGKLPVLSFLGKHSLIIYMLHQPLIYGLLMLIM